MGQMEPRPLDYRPPPRIKQRSALREDVRHLLVVLLIIAAFLAVLPLMAFLLDWITLR
jgi:hypothetical protein